jgi:hypothetical protein
MKTAIFTIVAVCALFASIATFAADPAPAPNEERITHLISKLGEKDWKKRVAATDELQRIGKPALPHLEKALTSTDEEVRSRVEFLIAQIKDAQPDLTLADLLQRVAKRAQANPADLKSLKSVCQKLLGNLTAQPKGGTVIMDANGSVTIVDNNGGMLMSDPAGNTTVMDCEGAIIAVNAEGKLTEHEGIGAAAAKKKIADLKSTVGKSAPNNVGGSIILDDNGAMTVMLDNGAVVVTDPDGAILMQNGLVPQNPFEAINQMFAQILGNLGEIRVGGAAMQGQLLVIQNGQVIAPGPALPNQALVLNENALIQQLLGAGQPVQINNAAQLNLANMGQILNQLLGQAGFANAAPQAQITPPAPKEIASADLLDTFGARLGEAADGLRVTDLKPNSPAANAGLLIGDLIAKVNGREAASLDAVKDLLTKPDPENPLKLEVTRKDETVQITVSFK